MHRSSSVTRRPAARRAVAAIVAGATRVGVVAGLGSPAEASRRARPIADPLATHAQEALDAMRAMRLVEEGAVPPSTVAADAHAIYVREQLEVATEVAARVGGTPQEFVQAWNATSDQRRTVVYTGLAQVGDVYRARGQGPDAFDCSGFTGFAWAATGTQLPRNSSAQIRASQRVDAAALEPGDLVWRPGHVMLYLGVGEAVAHSPQSGRNVEVRDWGRVRQFGDPLADGV